MVSKFFIRVFKSSFFSRLCTCDWSTDGHISNRKRRYSSKHSNDGLEPVSEDSGFHHPDPNCKVSELSGKGPTPEQGKIYLLKQHSSDGFITLIFLCVEISVTVMSIFAELLMETGPTQTQQPIINQPLEKVTDAIRMYVCLRPLLD